MNKLLKSFIFIIFIINANCIFSQERSLDDIVNETTKELSKYIINKHINNKSMEKYVLPSGAVISFNDMKLPIISIGKIFKDNGEKHYVGGEYFFNVTFANGIVITISNGTYEESKKDRDYILKLLNIDIKE